MLSWGELELYVSGTFCPYRISLRNSQPTEARLGLARTLKKLLLVPIMKPVSSYPVTHDVEFAGSPPLSSVPALIMSVKAPMLGSHEPNSYGVNCETVRSKLMAAQEKNLPRILGS